MADLQNPASSNTSITPSYTTDAGAVQDRINALTKETAQGYKDLPSYQDQLAKRTMEEEGFIKPTAEARANMIQQLFEHDKNYSTQFADPKSSSFIENPMARSSGQNAMAAPLWATLSSLGADIATRRALLGDTIQRAVQARRDELASKDTDLANLWKTLGLYQTQQKEAEAKAAKLTDVATWQDVGDRIVGFNSAGKEITSVPKGTDAATKALLEAAKKQEAKEAQDQIDFDKQVEEEAMKDFMTKPPGERMKTYQEKIKGGKPMTQAEVDDYNNLKSTLYTAAPEGGVTRGPMDETYKIGGNTSGTLNSGATAGSGIRIGSGVNFNK